MTASHVGNFHLLDQQCQCKSDSNADTCVIGSNTELVIADFERPVSVGDLAQCKTVSAIVTYTINDVTNYMLIIHQTIIIPDVEVKIMTQNISNLKTTGIRGKVDAIQQDRWWRITFHLLGILWNTPLNMVCKQYFMTPSIEYAEQIIANCNT